MSLSGVFLTVLLCISLGLISVWFVLNNYNHFTVAVDDQNNLYIYAENYVYGDPINWNTIGIILLNVWTCIAHLALIGILQFSDNTFLDKPIIFLLQQSLLMQLASFLTLNWIYKKIFLLPSGYDRSWWFTSDLFSGWWAARLLVALIMAQLLLLLLYILAVFHLHSKASDAANNRLHLFISFGCKIIVFVFINGIVSVYYPQSFIINDFLSAILSPSISSGILILMTFVLLTFRVTKWRNLDVKSLSKKSVMVHCVLSSFYGIGIIYYVSKYICIFGLESFCDHNQEECTMIADQINSSLQKGRYWLPFISIAPLFNVLAVILFDKYLLAKLALCFFRIDKSFLNKYFCAFNNNDPNQNELRRPLLNNDDENHQQRVDVIDGPQIEPQIGRFLADSNNQLDPNAPRNREHNNQNFDGTVRQQLGSQGISKPTTLLSLAQEWEVTVHS